MATLTAYPYKQQKHSHNPNVLTSRITLIYHGISRTEPKSQEKEIWKIGALISCLNVKSDSLTQFPEIDPVPFEPIE